MNKNKAGRNGGNELNINEGHRCVAHLYLWYFVEQTSWQWCPVRQGRISRINYLRHSFFRRSTAILILFNRNSKVQVHGASMTDGYHSIPGTSSCHQFLLTRF